MLQEGNIFEGMGVKIKNWNIPFCSVLTFSSVEYGPVPIAVLAAIMQIYSVCGLSKSTVNDSVDVKNSLESSRGEESGVTVMLYPVIIPFLSDGAGGSQMRVKLLEDMSTAWKLRGALLGTVYKKSKGTGFILLYIKTVLLNLPS